MSEIHERLFNLSGEMLCTATARGFFVELNPAWEATLGWTREELCSRPFVEFVHPEDRDATLAATARLAGGSHLVSFENRYACKDGSYRRLLWRAQAPRSASELIIASARDMTGVRSEGAGDPVAPFRALFAGLGDFGAILAVGGALTHLNAAGRELLGLMAGETGVRTPDRFLASDDAARLVEAWIPAALASGGWEGPAELLRRDGASIEVSLTLVPIRDAGGAAVAVAAVAHDRAAAARFEEELQRRFSQQEVLSATSTPIIQVWDDIITMPVVGLVDSVRSADMKTTLLEVVGRTGARFAIIDLTGVDTVDTATADHLLKVMRAVQLLGARCVITGIQPAVAQIIVGLGLDLHGVITLRSLREGLRFCLRRLGFKIHREAPLAPVITSDAQGTESR